MPRAREVPVTILTGFLGSGKTTLLNYLLKQDHGMKFAIIENEFGEVGVDDGVLKMDSEDQVIEVMNGCICCTVRGDLAEVLKGKLAKRIADFDGIIIETTGLADPAPVAQTFFVDDDVKALYKLDGIITVVDAKHSLEHLNEEKPEGVENESVEQVAFADRIILNKIDLVTDEELAQVEEKVRSINSSVEIIRAQNSVVDPKKLINISAFSLDRVTEMDPEFLNTDGEHMHDQSVSTCSSTFEGELNMGLLQNWIGELMRTKGTDLFRYKGILAVKGLDQKLVFQGVHMLFTQTLLEGEGSTWQPGEPRACTFVFIGRNLDKEGLVESFHMCKVTEPLRFKEGDAIETQFDGKWVAGKVLKTWDKGHPYRIELNDGKGTQIWAPHDYDTVVRPAAKKFGFW